MSSPAITGSNTDPEFRRERARLAASSRHSLDAYIGSIVRRAPELTDEQIERLRDLLPPAEAGR